MSSHAKDKRRHPRFKREIRVESHDRRLQLETVDLSVGGLCCRAPVFLAPMTKMAVSLVLPGDGPGGTPAQTVRGEAVVVRTDPGPAEARPADGMYRIALFFSRMDEADRERLRDFLKHLGGKNDRA